MRADVVQEMLGKALCLLVLVTLTPWRGHVARAQQCVGVDGCGCVFDDGSVIDVSSLGNTDGTARFKDVIGNDMYHYSYNPCKPFSEVTCSDASVCQISADMGASYQAGDYDKATWSYDGTNVLVTYSSDADPTVSRSSVVTYVCDESKTTPDMVAIGETTATVYEMTVTSKCACKNGCSGGAIINVTVEATLSTGSILLIIFFVLLIVYIIGGIVFNRYRRQATGTDMVPNASFWRAIPGYVKDGFVFTTSKIRPKRSGYDEV